MHSDLDEFVIVTIPREIFRRVFEAALVLGKNDSATVVVDRDPTDGEMSLKKIGGP